MKTIQVHISLWIVATTAIAGAFCARAEDEPGGVPGLQGIPAPWQSSDPGGWDSAAAAAGPKPLPETGGATMQVTAVKVVDGNDNPISVTPGVPFWVEIDWQYTNPNCTNYTLMRVVNGWTNVAPAVNYGCGYNGITYWYHYWGAWVLYKAGVYPITVTVDPGNTASAPSAAKTMTINLTVGGSILPQWALVEAEFGRTNLSPGTDVIVGSMDDAFDFLHPWFTGTDSRGRPRLILAAENTLGPGGSPTNDFHDTSCMGIVLARSTNNGDITGMAPDARYVIAEFINRANVPGLPEMNVVDAANVMMTNGADIINMPWSWWTDSVTNSELGESPVTALLADYLAYASNRVVVAYVNELTSPTIPTAPGSARNVITVGGTGLESHQCVGVRQFWTDAGWTVQAGPARRQCDQLYCSLLGLARRVSRRVWLLGQQLRGTVRGRRGSANAGVCERIRIESGPSLDQGPDHEFRRERLERPGDAVVQLRDLAAGPAARDGHPQYGARVCHVLGGPAAYRPGGSSRI